MGSRTELVQHAGSAGARFPRCRLRSGSPPGLPWPRSGLCRNRPSLRCSRRKPVVKEVEVPVTTLKFEVAETGCKNSFGNPVPCKREAAEDAVEVGAEAAPAEAAAPAAAAVLPLGLPFGYAS